jgi:hypothetical protein
LLKKVQDTREKDIHDKLHRQKDDIHALTEDEKQRRLQAMESTAIDLDSSRISRYGLGKQ